MIVTETASFLPFGHVAEFVMLEMLPRRYSSIVMPMAGMIRDHFRVSSAM